MVQHCYYYSSLSEVDRVTSKSLTYGLLLTCENGGDRNVLTQAAAISANVLILCDRRTRYARLALYACRDFIWETSSSSSWINCIAHRRD
jgi:hypothetical protein